jgi:hypothetical protein
MGFRLEVSEMPVRNASAFFDIANAFSVCDSKLL